ncbi:MAG: hypothetical protein ACNA7J_08040, partial [Wenzhouxiangella sp.]
MIRWGWVLIVAFSVVGCEVVESLDPRPSPDAMAHLVLIADVQVGAIRLARAAGESTTGNFNAFGEIQDQRDRINRAMSLLHAGDPSTGLAPLPASMHLWLDNVEHIWHRIDESAQELLALDEPVLHLAEQIGEYSALVPWLQAAIDGVLRELIASGATIHEVYMVSRQLVLADRMLRRAGQIMSGGVGTTVAADALSRDSAIFRRVLEGLVSGDEQLQMTAIDNEDALSELQEVITLYAKIGDGIDAVLGAFPELVSAREAADSIWLDSELLADQAAHLAGAYTDSN